MLARAKKILSALAGNVGYRLYRLALKADRNRKLVRPLATYAPWGSDSGFLQVYGKIQSHTLVDIYRCYELWQLLPQTAGLHGAIIEVGVWRGGTGALLAERARSSGIQANIYLCDTFQGVVKAGEADPRYSGGEHATGIGPARDLAEVQFGLKNVRFLTGIFPEQTANLVSETSIRFCHIDVDVYQSARETLEWVWERLEVGGIVVYDDYGFTQTAGVTRHVNEQVGLPDRRVIYNLNGHAVIIRTA
jgi:O-methyltransferase